MKEKKPAKPLAPIKKPVITIPTLESFPVVVEKYGVSLGMKAGTNAGAFCFGGDVDYSVANIVKDTSVRLSLDYLSGKNPVDNDDYSIYNIKMGITYSFGILKSSGIPVDWYAGAGILLPIKVKKNRIGKWGAEIYGGGKYILSESRKIYVEIGYSGIKYADSSPAIKGVLSTIGYSYSF